MKSIILLAPPAAGKGTQSSLLCEKYGFVHISTGDLIRESIALGDAQGAYLTEMMTAGKLVEDGVILSLLQKKVQKIHGDIGYILDGFPRNLNQAKEYDRMLSSIGQKISSVIYLTIPYEEAKKRIAGRLSCPKCGRVYNEFISLSQPKEVEICDDCHLPLLKRVDDNEKIFEARYETYLNETTPLIDYYNSQNILSKIDSTLSTDKVFEQIESIVVSL